MNARVGGWLGVSLARWAGRAAASQTAWRWVAARSERASVGWQTQGCACGGRQSHWKLTRRPACPHAFTPCRLRGLQRAVRRPRLRGGRLQGARRGAQPAGVSEPSSEGSPPGPLLLAGREAGGPAAHAPGGSPALPQPATCTAVQRCPSRACCAPTCTPRSLQHLRRQGSRGRPVPGPRARPGARLRGLPRRGPRLCRLPGPAGHAGAAV